MNNEDLFGKVVIIKNKEYIIHDKEYQNRSCTGCSFNNEKGCAKNSSIPILKENGRYISCFTNKVIFKEPGQIQKGIRKMLKL